MYEKQTMNVQFYVKKSDPDPQHYLQTSEREEKMGLYLTEKERGKIKKLPDNFRIRIHTGEE
jgi:hypothetical protein